MRVYAHWLDGEYRKALTGATEPNPWTAHDLQAERLLKTFALFGASVVLSDAQVVDSPVLWRLFADGSFRLFVRRNPEYLQLIANPVSPNSDQRWAIATSGLELALRAGRIASPMHDPSSFVSFYQQVLTQGPVLDLDRLLATRSGTPDIEPLIGFSETLKYFLSPEARVASLPAGRTRHTLYDILHLALGNPQLTGSDGHHVEGTLALIDRVVEAPEDRVRRAVIHNQLDLNQPHHVGAWRTIVQAWNVAVQKSVCETGGSIGNLPRSVPVGAYVDQPADILLVGDSTRLESGQLESAPGREFRLGWDPGDLDWQDLNEIVEATSDVRADLHRALLGNDGEHKLHEMRRFADAVASNAPGRLEPPINRWWIWALGGVALRFGGPEAPMLGVAFFAGQAGQDAIVWALNALRDRMIAARVSESAQAIQLTGSSSA